MHSRRPDGPPTAKASGRPPATISIQDVASAAAVSTATVSRVLNNPRLVAPATAQRVQQTIQRLGYRPNLLAQSLTTRKSRVLGIALPDIHGEFYSELLRGADAAARELGYHLLVSSEARIDSERGWTGGASLAFGLIGGLALMITEPNPSLLEEAHASNLPLVVLDADVQEPGIDSIVVDNEVGAREATEHLMRGVPPDRCYFVGGPAGNFDTQQRARAFAIAVQARAGRLRPDQVAHGEYSIDWGREWVGSMLPRGLLNSSGVLAGNDEIAIGIIQGAQDAGLTVPGDVRVVGFDDTRLASLVRPRLSTVRVPLADVGATAIRTLVHRIDDPGAPRSCVRLPTSLVVRESSEPAAG